MKKPEMNPVYRRRLWKHRIGIALSFFAMAVGLFFLMWILLTLVVKGVGAIDMAMFTQTTPAPGSEGGGLMNAIVGSLLMVSVAVFISTPIGILAGIYLAEYGKGHSLRDRHHVVGAVDRDRSVRVCNLCCQCASFFRLGRELCDLADCDSGSCAYYRQHA